jgi:peptidylprolyl isomerase
VNQQRMTKAQRRAAAKAASQARAALDRRRRRAWTGGLAALAVLVVVVAVFVAVRGGDDGDDTATPTPTASASSPATDPNFPPLPPGADPALATPPTASKGAGELTKLTVKTLVKGAGAATRAGQRITVNYLGVSYRTGEKFDASWDRGQVFPFTVGQGEVIPGWDQGLVGVPVGSRVQLDIPANLAYGDNPTGGQPAGPLRFIVDVLDAQ